MSADSAATKSQFDASLTKQVVLRNTASDGTPLTAIFMPGRGMNLVSYRRGDVEVIDQTTRCQFNERNAGLGALIGPHFHRRNPNILPPVKGGLFSHTAAIKEKGSQDPFSHGIARYVNWRYEATENSIKAELSGKDEWKGVPVSEIEGQDFVFQYNAQLTRRGLEIEMNIRSDTDSLVGLHYYYHLPKGKGTVTSRICNMHYDQGEIKPNPESWNINTQKELQFDLIDEADFGMLPFPNRCEGEITLDAINYRLKVLYQTKSEENCWQLYHPKGASFVCIEPMTAENPRKPQLTVSSIKVQLLINT